MREYIIPNWHAILVHTPLGLLTTGLILEILTLLWRRSSARQAARWMILIGALAAVPAMTSGIYAYHDVIAPTVNVDGDDFTNTWPDLMEGTVKDRAPDSRTAGATEIKEVEVGKALAGDLGRELKHHIWRNAFGLVGVFLVVMTFIGCSDFWRRRLYVPLLLLLIAAQGLMINGAHMGGLVVYEQGAAVQPLPPGTPVDVKATMQETLKRYVPPIQLHFTAAGWMVGLALIALALSIRAISESGAVTSDSPSADEEWFRTHETPAGAAAPPMMSPVNSGTYEQAAADASEGISDPASPPPFGVIEPPPPAIPTRAATVTTVRTTTTTVAPVATAAGVPSARMWLLALLAGVVTFVAGLWQVSAWSWDALMGLYKENRNTYHILLGTAIVVLTVVATFLARFARRAKAALTVVALLLFAALALQIYVGVLLTFDSPKKKGASGLIAPLKWNVPKKEAAMAPPMLKLDRPTAETR